MEKGDSFGELALYYNTVRDATVRAIDVVHCLALGRDALTNILGNKIQKITFRNIYCFCYCFIISIFLYNN